jgi:hypothetical protein
LVAYWYSERPKPKRFQEICPGVNTELGIDSRKPYLGRWSGKWDNTWAVDFDVTDAPDKNGFLVVYRWEEQVGQPKLNKTLLACLLKNELTNDQAVFTLKLDALNPDEALLIGAFSRHTRQAIMHRISSAV